MRSVGTLATAYLSGELLDHLDKRDSIKYKNKFLVYRITSTFPLGLAIISIFIKEKKYVKGEHEVNTAETLAHFCKFIS